MNATIALDERATRLTDQYQDLRTQRLPYEVEWREQVEFLAPNARRLLEGAIPGQRQTQRLYDTTGPDASRKLANYLNGVVTSSSTRFQSIVTRDPELMKDREATIWLDDSSTRLFSAYQQSNFKGCMAQGYGSLVRHGTTALYVEERARQRAGFNGFRYHTFPVGRFVVTREADGTLHAFMHEFDLTAHAAMDAFGMDRLSDQIRSVLEKHPYERFTFVQAMQHADDRSGPWPIVSCYWEKGTRTIVKEDGYHEWPVFVPDWERDEGELYGRGPGHIAMPDVRSLNRLKQLGLEALALQVRPPLQVPHDGVLGGQVRLTPAAQNMMLTDREITPMNLGGDLKSEMLKGDELRQAIRAVFHRDLIALPDKNYMTATEILKNLELINRELGPTLGNLEDGLLKPHAERTYAMMYRAGAFLPPPPSLAGAVLDVEFEGPLARAQRSGDVTALQTALSLLVDYSQHDPEALDLPDTDEIVKYTWEVTGNPMRLLRSNSVIQARRQARADAEAQQQQAAIGNSQMDMIQKGAGAMQTMKDTFAPAQAAPAGHA